MDGDQGRSRSPPSPPRGAQAPGREQAASLELTVGPRLLAAIVTPDPQRGPVPEPRDGLVQQVHQRVHQGRSSFPNRTTRIARSCNGFEAAMQLADKPPNSSS